MQGDLLKERNIFSSFDEGQMRAVNLNLCALYFGPQPLKLLFIVQAIHNIGR